MILQYFAFYFDTIGTFRNERYNSIDYLPTGLQDIINKQSGIVSETI